MLENCGVFLILAGLGVAVLMVWYLSRAAGSRLIGLKTKEFQWGKNAARLMIEFDNDYSVSWCVGEVFLEFKIEGKWVRQTDWEKVRIYSQKHSRRKRDIAALLRIVANDAWRGKKWHGVLIKGADSI